MGIFCWRLFVSCLAWRWAGGTRSLVRQAGLVGGPLSRCARTGSAGGVQSRTARTGSADRLLGSAVLLSRDGGSLPRPASAGTAAHDGRMRSSVGVLTIIVIIVNLASMRPPPHGPHGPNPMSSQSPYGRTPHELMIAFDYGGVLVDRIVRSG